MDDFMLDNLYRCFDWKNRGQLSQEEYVRGMGLFLSEDLDLKIKLCFQVKWPRFDTSLICLPSVSSSTLVKVNYAKTTDIHAPFTKRRLQAK